MSVITAGITPKKSKQDPWYVRAVLIAITVAFLGFMVVGPIVNVFGRAFEQGAAVFFRALVNPNTLHALGLTVLAASLAVLFNMTFGLAAAWAIARFHFRGKALLTSLIDLPFSVSPVIAGLIFVLLFGTYGYFAPMLRRFDIHIITAIPGIVLATTFVTFPFIARELIPVLEALGPDEEEAARTLGASPWQMFRHVTFPNIKWGLLYGVLLCNARAIGEFGAVNVVSGRMTGKTETLPIVIARLYEGMGAAAAASAFAVATLLACLAFLTLIYKTYLEYRAARDLLSSQGNES